MSSDTRETIALPPSPIIVLPEERRDQLELKLQEYRDRIYDNPDTRTCHPDLLLIRGCDAAYKTEVLVPLLRDGRVETHGLSLELAERVEGRLDIGLFENACGVMRDYCETGGENAMNGTGLPEMPVEETEK